MNTLNMLIEQALPILALCVSSLLIFGSLAAAGDWTVVGMLILAAFVAAIALPLSELAFTAAGNANVSTISSVAPTLGNVPRFPTQPGQQPPAQTGTLPTPTGLDTLF